MKNCLLFSKNLMEREEISLIGDLKDESNDNKISKVISVLPKEEGGEGKFIGDKNLWQGVKNWIFDVKKMLWQKRGKCLWFYKSNNWVSNRGEWFLQAGVGLFIFSF